MSTLTNQQIDATYQGLIKTTDNAAINATPKALEDGVGNALPIEVGTDRINFTDTIDFSGATVTGLAAGGLVAGTGTDAMKSADFLTTNPAVASNTGSIALGNGAISDNYGGIAIGLNADSGTSQSAISIGSNSDTQGFFAVALGNGAQATKNEAIAIGKSASASGLGAIAIGEANASAQESMAFGGNTRADAVGAVAIGPNLFASIANTVSLKELECQTVGGGVIMYSPNGTGYKLTVSDAGAPVFTAI